MFRLKLVVIAASAGLLLVGSGMAMAATGHLPDPVRTLLPGSGSDPGQPSQTPAAGNGAVQPQAQDVNQTPAGTGNQAPATPVEATEPAEPVEAVEAVEATEPVEAVEATEPATEGSGGGGQAEAGGGD